MALIATLIFCGFLPAAILSPEPVLSRRARWLGKRQLVVILIDNMRWDYVERMPRRHLGGFLHFIRDGVRAEYVETVFPSSTFPAWMTLQTGLYPESHDVLHNTVYDRSTGVTHKDEDTVNLPKWQQNGVPIERTAARNGMRVATINWLKTSIPWNERVVPIEVLPAPSSLDNQIESIILALKQGFRMILMYYVKLDKLGHKFGPDSSEVMEEMRRIGRALEALFSFIKGRERARDVIVMLVSDHGMAPCSAYPEVDLSEYVDIKSETEKVVHDGVYAIYAEPSRRKALFEKLIKVPHYSTFLKRDIPEKYYYKGGVYAPDILMVPEPLNNVSLSVLPKSCSTHGSDPTTEPDTRTVFLGWGEAFVGGGFVNPPLHLVDIYQLYGHVLGLPLEPHHGSRCAVCSMLSKKGRGTRTSLADTLKPHLLCFVLFFYIVFKSMQTELFSVKTRINALDTLFE